MAVQVHSGCVVTQRCCLSFVMIDVHCVVSLVLMCCFRYHCNRFDEKDAQVARNAQTVSTSKCAESVGVRVRRLFYTLC